MCAYHKLLVGITCGLVFVAVAVFTIPSGIPCLGIVPTVEVSVVIGVADCMFLLFDLVPFIVNVK